MSDIVFSLIASLCCLFAAATAAGLTLGVLSLDVFKLKVIQRSKDSSEEERRYVEGILPLLEDRHYLMCTLLLCNSLANEALPVFLGDIVNPFFAVLISVTLVLLVGEVLPAAVFTGPDQLFIAYKLTDVIRMLQYIFYPLAYPMARGLDTVLGHEAEEYFGRGELQALININHEVSSAAYNENSITSHGSSDSVRKIGLRTDEVQAIQGVLSLSEKKAEEIMIPIGIELSLTTTTTTTTIN